MKSQIASGTFDMSTRRWGKISNECKDFVTSLLQVDPKERLTAKQALQHSWIQKYVKAPTVKLDASKSLLEALESYRAAPKFRRYCLLAMAWLLTSQETAQLQEEFLAIDKDQQGTISLLELKDVLVQKYGVADDKITEIYKAMDVNHDNEVHYTEYLAAMLSTRIHLRRDHINVAFRNFDTDLSGYITAENLRDAFGSTLDGKRVDSLLSEADIREDGRVAFDEFVAFVCDTPLGSKELGLPYAPKLSRVPPVSFESPRGKGNQPPKCCTLM
jgi:calcium-dependent protein kinase